MNRNSENAILGFTDKYFPFSNFFDNGVMQLTVQGLGFTSVEAAFQAKKTCLDASDGKQLRTYRTLLGVFAQLTPDEAKVIGRNLKLREDWESVKDDIMFNLVFQKFTNNYQLRDLLLSTGDMYLEETNNWHDNYWGNCTCEKCRDIEGKNHLGLFLMKVRELLQHQ